MKRAYILMLSLFVVLMPLSKAEAANTQSTGYTITLNTDGKKQISQDAYLPTESYFDLSLNGAEDLCLVNDLMYIADTKNARVLVVSLETKEVQVVGEGFLMTPKGVAADEDGNIYVADIGKKEVYLFSPTGELKQTFVKPTVPAFGLKAEFAPAKVAPADGEGVYIISEGSTAGIIHMDGEGNFLGYFAADSAKKSFVDRLADLILTEEQKKYFLKITPPSYQNIFREPGGLIYSIIKGPGAKISRHSLAGNNLLRHDHVPAVDHVQDICVASDGRMFVLSREGSIVEMTRDGYMLCSFGGKADGQDKVGLFKMPVGIGIDSKNQIYVLDQEQNLIQVFAPTPTGDSIREAIICYNNGDYSGSIAILSELLKFNNTSFFAHLYMGKNSMQTGEYETAAYHFKTANAKADYSEAYWEIRNVWLQENLLYYLVAFLFALLLFAVLKRIGVLSKIKGKISRLSVRQKLNNNRTFYGVGKIKYALFHPIDTAYEVKVGRLSSTTTAIILYVLFFIEFVLFQLCSGYIFSIPVKNYSLFLNFMFFFGAIILFVIGNYFISSIQDGNGTLLSIFKVTAYSLAPSIFVFPIVTVFSNFMSIEDEFFRTTAMTVVILWSVCNLFAGLIEIHQYRFGELIKNILLTLFFMGVAIIILSLFYLFLRQIVMYFYEVFVEVSLRG